MKISIIIRSVFVCLMTLLPLSVGAEGVMLIDGQSAPLGPVGGAQSTVSSRSLLQAPTPEAGSSKPATVFRDVPSISGSYSVGGKTLMPYVGAGFNSGYASDLDRSLHAAPSNPTDPNLRGLFGQTLAPNEFQMGLRIPF